METSTIGPIIWFITSLMWLVTLGFKLYELRQRDMRDRDRERDMERSRAMSNEWIAGYNAGKSERSPEEKARDLLGLFPRTADEQTSKPKKRVSRRKLERAREQAYELGYITGKEETWSRTSAMLEPNAERPDHTEPWPLYELWRRLQSHDKELKLAATDQWAKGYESGEHDAWDILEAMQRQVLEGKIIEGPAPGSHRSLVTAWAHALVFKTWAEEITKPKAEEPSNGQTEKLEPRPDAAPLGGD